MVLLESLKIPMGTEAADFALEATDGKKYSLADFSDARVIVVIFMCNHCPYVQAIWGRLNILQAKFADEKVQFVGINPNLNPDYPEESMDMMKKYYQDYDMNFPYLQDARQKVAREYEAQCTPDIFVYGENRGLIYHGRLDDNWQDKAAVKKRELEDFLNAYLEGNEYKEEQKPSMGCSIKWRNQ